MEGLSDALLLYSTSCRWFLHEPKLKQSCFLSVRPPIALMSFVWQRFSKILDTHKSHKNGQ